MDDMRHCENCGFLGVEGYEYPESYCTVGVQDDDPKYDEDEEGCGCRYNIRTLRKMKEENDQAEYFCYLGYDDLFLMPTIEYTEENKKILEKHRELMRHALGLDSCKPYTRHGKQFYRPYRNYFTTHQNTPDYPYLERLVVPGLMAKATTKNQGIVYTVTRRGMDWLGQHDHVHIYDKK